jgi:pimeloyl-ACP methyl ester carboxylesterase
MIKMKTIKTLHIILLCCLIQGIAAQGVLPEDWGLNAYQINDPELGEINYYVTQKGIEQDKPVLFMVSGVRGLPVMLVISSGDQSTQLGSIPPDQIFSFADDYHVVFISKAGTPFSDTSVVDEINPMKNLEEYQPSEEYIQKCGMEWEIAASIKVIAKLSKQLSNSQNKVIALGISEGGQLIPKLAHECSHITHLVGLSTSGLNQFYSSIINRRMDANAGRITHQEAQEAIDDLFEVYKKVYADPESTEKWYYGHPYKRWGSFCSDIPLDHLVELDIPILYVKGTADRNSSVLHSDYIMLEFIRLGKTNLTYKTFPGVDHWLNETVLKDGKRDHISRRKEVFDSIADWVNEN